MHEERYVIGQLNSLHVRIEDIQIARTARSRTFSSPRSATAVKVLGRHDDEVKSKDLSAATLTHQRL